MSTAPGGFYPLDVHSWLRACSLGLHPAVAYLLLVSGRRGTGGRGTRWGVHAVETYGGLSRRQAKHAILLLQHAGLVSAPIGQTRTLLESDAPLYVWLPHALLRGAAAEPSPLVRLRETGDVLTLQLAVHLYDRHLVDTDDNGLPLSLYRQAWTKTVLCRHRQWYVAAFHEGNRVSSSALREDDPLTAPHIVAARKGQKRDHQPFFDRMQGLAALGLLRPVVRLMESGDPDAIEAHTLAPPHIVAHPDIPREVEVAREAEQAAYHLLVKDPDAMARYEAVYSGRTVVLPIKGHMASATLVTGWRLTYRPHTKHTARWLATVTETCEATLADYRRLSTAWNGAVAVA